MSIRNDTPDEFAFRGQDDRITNIHSNDKKPSPTELEATVSPLPAEMSFKEVGELKQGLHQRHIQMLPWLGPSARDSSSDLEEL
jgi:hypothetical protein